MFTTINEVKEFTGYDVTQDTIIMAQNLMEAYVGRLEVNVSRPEDHAVLAKATAYQAAYMHGDQKKVFEQMGATQILQQGNMVSFDPKSASPWISPLAVLACRGLSWNRLRSVRTGPMFPRVPVVEGWKYE